MKEKLLIRFTIGAAVLSIMISGVFFLYASNTKRITADQLIEIPQSETVKLSVKDIVKTDTGDVIIKLFTKNENISYEFHNWTLGSGEAPYKNIQIALLQNNEIILGKTYPYGVELLKEDAKNGFIESDGCICYMRNVQLEDDYKIAVIYLDRDDNKYIVYQE